MGMTAPSLSPTATTFGRAQRTVISDFCKRTILCMHMAVTRQMPLWRDSAVGWGKCNEPQHVRCLLRRLCWGLRAYRQPTQSGGWDVHSEPWHLPTG
ncbi:MAG: hypothetical protein H6937_05940 [Burkholderiales bacterium]|nr:hypothetical protein [Burkholderiales bacterium]